MVVSDIDILELTNRIRTLEKENEELKKRIKELEADQEKKLKNARIKGFLSAPRGGYF